MKIPNVKLNRVSVPSSLTNLKQRQLEKPSQQDSYTQLLSEMSPSVPSEYHPFFVRTDQDCASVYSLNLGSSGTEKTKSETENETTTTLMPLQLSPDFGCNAKVADVSNLDSDASMFASTQAVPEASSTSPFDINEEDSLDFLLDSFYPESNFEAGMNMLEETTKTYIDCSSECNPDGNFSASFCSEEGEQEVQVKFVDGKGSATYSGRKRKRGKKNEWTNDEVVLLLTCTKLLINYELKTMQDALFQLIDRDPGKCLGRAAEKKLKRMKLFTNWRCCNRREVVRKIDDTLTRYKPISRELRSKMLTIVDQVKKNIEKVAHSFGTSQ